MIITLIIIIINNQIIKTNQRIYQRKLIFVNGVGDYKETGLTHLVDLVCQ